MENELSKIKIVRHRNQIQKYLNETELNKNEIRLVDANQVSDDDIVNNIEFYQDLPTREKVERGDLEPAYEYLIKIKDMICDFKFYEGY